MPGTSRLVQLKLAEGIAANNTTIWHECLLRRQQLVSRAGLFIAAAWGIISPDENWVEDVTVYTIAVSPEMYTALRQRAQQVRTSPDKVVEEALRVYFGHEEQAWQHAFEGLIAKVQARTLPFSSAEIEADITAAADEVRELRCARRRTD